MALEVACGILPTARSSPGHTTPLPARSPSPSTPSTGWRLRPGETAVDICRRILIIRAPQKGRLYGSCDTEAVYCAASAYRPASPPHAECIASVLYGGGTPLRLWQHFAPTVYPEAQDMAWPISSRYRRSSIGLRLGKGWSRPRITLIAACDLGGHRSIPRWQQNWMLHHQTRGLGRDRGTLTILMILSLPCMHRGRPSRRPGSGGTGTFPSKIGPPLHNTDRDLRGGYRIRRPSASTSDVTARRQTTLPQTRSSNMTGIPVAASKRISVSNFARETRVIVTTCSAPTCS